MYLTYSKSLPSFDQHMVQLEFNVPEDSKVYVEFQEGFLALAAKYTEALRSLELIEAPVVEEVVLDEVPVVDDVAATPTVVHAPVEPVVDPVVEEVVVVEEVPVVDVVRLDPVSGSAPVIDPAQQVVDVPVVAKKTRKTSV
jgi:hypothetical protein